MKHIRNLPKTSNKSLCDAKTLEINSKYDLDEKNVSLIDGVMAIEEPMVQADRDDIVNIEPDVNVNYEGETMVNIFE